MKIKLGTSLDGAHGTMRHGDVAMAFALANYAASSGVSVPPPRKLSRDWRAVPAGKVIKHSWNKRKKGFF